MYKDHIEHYVNRRNTYNGRLYKEDPTIFYWDLINEPRWYASAWLLVTVGHTHGQTLPE